MDTVMGGSSADFQLLLLVVFRITGLMMVAPVFGSQVIPPPVKIFLSFVMALLFFPLLGRSGLTLEPGLGPYVVAIAGELAVGLVIGFVAMLLFAAVQLGGMLIDQEMGLMMANVIDPVSNEQVSVIGQFNLFLSIIVYLVIDGHHMLLSALDASFRSVPLMGFSLSWGAGMHVSDTLIRDVFEMGIQIAAPSIATLLLITLAMAFMARVVPEMNVFILGFALRIAVGLGVLFLGVGLFVHGFRGMTGRNFQELQRIVTLMGG